jgi:hypothetical protein
VIEVTFIVTQNKVAQKVHGGCDTGGGGIKSCVATVVATPDHTLDLADATETCEKLPSDDDNPCAFVTKGPLLSISEREARRGFTTNSGRVALTQIIGQFKLEKRPVENTIQKNITLHHGSRFTAKRLKTAAGVRLDCRLTTGEELAEPVGPNNLFSDQIKFIRVQTSEPYDLFTYEVTRK